ncbi:MAG: hypothetical protein R3Y57_03555 [Erysipelotrichaceae bacterium]
MKEIFQEYGGLIIAVIVISMLISYITLQDTGFAAQLTNGISESIDNLFDLSVNIP